MIAIIGGSGLTELQKFTHQESLTIKTPYAVSCLAGEEACSVDIERYRLEDSELFFLPRHGAGHKLPPHQVNYRGNLWALKQLGVTEVIAVNAVGAIAESFTPGSLAVPDQIIDYTQGRINTYFDGSDGDVRHIDFTYPYNETLRLALLQASGEVIEQFNASEGNGEGTNIESTNGKSTADAITVLSQGTYACSQGPRLETAAEIRRFAQDGCAMVGMTGMPEAALARELEINYAALALSVNWGAGLTEDLITMEEILAVIEQGMERIQACLLRAVKLRLSQ